MYKALRHGTTEVAVKFVPCLVADAQKLHQLRREIAIAKRVSYDKHIVQFYGACTTVNGAWLCMELMEARGTANFPVIHAQGSVSARQQWPPTCGYGSDLHVGSQMQRCASDRHGG